MIKRDSDSIHLFSTSGSAVIHFKPGGGADDVFSRLRVAEPVTLFDSQLTYDDQSGIFDEITINGGSVVYDNNLRAVQLKVDTTASAKALRRQHYWNRYQPGKSQQVMITGVLGASATDTVQRIGYFDDNDGMFFQNSSSGLAVVIRNSTAGSSSIQETVISQSDWAIDKLDGSGKSGHAIDPTKVQIFAIDFEALSVGRVRFGLDFGDGVIYCHKFVTANTFPRPFITNANLPVSYELENLATTSASKGDMYQIYATVISEGGFEDERSFAFTAANGSTTASVTTRQAILNIRPKLNFGSGSILNRGQVLPLQVDVLSQDNPTFVEVVYNGLSAGSSSWASVNDNSIVEFDTTGSTISGGSVVDAFFVPTNDKAQAARDTKLLSKLILSVNAAGDSRDTLSVVVTSLKETAIVSSVVGWKELR